VPTTGLEIGRQLGGGKGGGTGLLERTGLDLSQSSQEFSAKTDDTGGDGGNGNGIKNGGGGGDGDEGDDDEYRDDGDDEGGDDGFLSVRQALPEQFDRATLACVLAEWYRTIADLPAGIRMAVELGLVSSLQLVRFLAVDCRPTLVRAAHRVLPIGPARAFVGRLMADPSFLGKLAVEQAITLAAGTAYEAAARGPRLREEADLATVSVAGQLGANAAAVWLLAPSRTYGSPTSNAAQRLLQSLPNNVFDASGPLRQYTLATRVGSAALKAVQLAGVGAVLGTVTTSAQHALVARHKKTSGESNWRPSVRVPDLRTGALGTAAWLGLSCNARYNLLAGADRWMHERLSSLTAAVAGTCAMRLVNNHIGDASRIWLLGLPSSDALTQIGGRITGMAAAASASGSGHSYVRRRTSGSGKARRRSVSGGAQQNTAVGGGVKRPAGGSSTVTGRVSTVSPAGAQPAAAGGSPAARTFTVTAVGGSAQ